MRTGGVVVRGELVPGGKVGVDAHAGAAGRHVAGNQAGVRGEVVLRVFAVDADLHGEVGRLGVFFGQAQLRAEGHGDLLFDEVDAVTAFGDAVFHLKAGVHFDEVGFTLRGDEELHRGEGEITHLADQHTGVFVSLQLLSSIRYGLMHILDILGEIRREIKGLIFFLSINKINHGEQRNFKIINGIEESAVFLLFPCIKTIQQTDRINVHVRNICQFLGCQGIG